MSVFRKIKGTFQTAQQDLVDSFRAITSFDGHSKSEQLHHIKSKDIDLDVGADLLHEYQQIWSKIQNETKVCSKKAEGVDSSLSPMFVVWDKRAEIVSSLEDEVKSIPKIVSTLRDLHALLETIRQDFAIVETSLTMLENVCEDLELKKAVEEETRKLSNYRNQKGKEAERIKVNLARTHAKKMQDIESSKSVKLKERAEAFTSQFKEDVDYYKTHGRPDNKMVTEFPKVTSLSQIDIADDGGKDLDTFLGPQADEEPACTQAEGSKDAATGEQYFEDDYTADFSVKEDIEGPEEDNDLRSSPLFLNDQDDEIENIVHENGSSDESSHLEASEIINVQQDSTDLHRETDTTGPNENVQSCVEGEDIES